jgi:hypothetical protein
MAALLFPRLAAKVCFQFARLTGLGTFLPLAMKMSSGNYVAETAIDHENVIRPRAQCGPTHSKRH